MLAVVSDLHGSADLQPVNFPSDENVAALVREMFDLPADFPLSDETGPDDVPGWDSIGTLDLVSAAEERFGIRLSLEQVADLATVADFKRMLRPAGNTGAADGG